MCSTSRELSREDIKTGATSKRSIINGIEMEKAMSMKMIFT
jgi:hypothetical protein